MLISFLFQFLCTSNCIYIGDETCCTENYVEFSVWTFLWRIASCTWSMHFHWLRIREVTHTKSTEMFNRNFGQNDKSWTSKHWNDNRIDLVCGRWCWWIFSFFLEFNWYTTFCFPFVHIFTFWNEKTSTRTQTQAKVAEAQLQSFSHWPTPRLFLLNFVFSPFYDFRFNKNVDAACGFGVMRFNWFVLLVVCLLVEWSWSAYRCLDVNLCVRCIWSLNRHTHTHTSIEAHTHSGHTHSHSLLTLWQVDIFVSNVRTSENEQRRRREEETYVKTENGQNENLFFLFVVLLPERTIKMHVQRIHTDTHRHTERDTYTESEPI